MRRSDFILFGFALGLLTQVMAPETVVGQTLLFKSGFENSTKLSPVPPGAVGPTGNHQSFSGTDLSTAFTWPIGAYSPATSLLHLAPWSQSTDLLTNHFYNRIESMTGHKGTTTKVLSVDIENYPNQSCCAQAMLQTSRMATPIHAEYWKAWIKLPPELLTQFQVYPTPRYGWRMIWEFKTNHDYRMMLNLSSINGIAHWHLDADPGGLNPVCGYADPITGVEKYNCGWHFVDIDNDIVPVPIDQWFLLEVYIKRSTGSDGRFFVAVNGQTIGDRHGANYGMSKEEIYDMYYVNLYGVIFPLREWIDDIEIWNAPPCATLPCGASGTGSGFHGTIPPVVTSPAGVVGKVGVPFRYQVTAANSGTYFYTNSPLPRGLSINHATGLISGTPTTAGISTPWLEVTNTAGKGAQPLEIQINLN